MKWVSSLHISNSFEKSLRAIGRDLKKKLGRKKANFGFISISYAFREEIVDLWGPMRKELPIETVIGCTAGGVIGGEHEIEDQAAISVTAAILPKVKIQPFHFHQENLPDLDGSPRPWRELVKVTSKAPPSFLILSDPFSLDCDRLVEGFDFAYPESTKVGGLASGGNGPNENLLILNERIFHKGTVGVAFVGNLQVQTVVAQGCRPIG
ncbi:hypothetical protein BVX98_01530, partial [bacterium F11]